MTRRELIQAGAAFALPWSGAEAKQHPLAGYATAAMAVDDVRRLATLDARAPKALRSALLKDGEAARLGCGLPKPAAVTGAAPESQLAASAGALIAHTAMPLLAVAPDPIALDAALLAARLPVAKPLLKAAYLEYLHAIDLRCQIELHTLDPEESDIHAWVEGTAGWFHETRSYLDALATALAAGASSPAFDMADAVFRLAERVRFNEAVSARDLQVAKPTSTYGKALAASLDALASLK